MSKAMNNGTLAAAGCAMKAWFLIMHDKILAGHGALPKNVRDALAHA